MKNPPWLCTGCNKLHSNPLIEHFNEYVAHTCHTPPPPPVELELYRCYMAGMCDMLKLLSMISQLPEEISELLVNQLAINVRDGILLAIEDATLKARVSAHLTKELCIRENKCSHN